MSILSKIQSGKIGRAQRTVIYAPEGFGKSTIASLFPAPLFLDVEDSTSQLDVARLSRADIPDLAAFESAIAEIVKVKPCATLVVDTVDWLEEMAVLAVIAADDKKYGAKNIEEVAGGFGKGYNFLTNRFSVVLSHLDRVIDAGIHVVLLAHASVVRFDPPDGAGAYDRYELKLFKDRKGGKGTASLIKEWADIVAFGNWRTQIAEKGRGDATTYKGVGGRERQMHCNRSAAWDAKNRHGLADVEKWEVATFEKAFKGVGAPWGAVLPAPIANVRDAGIVAAQIVADLKPDEIPMHFDGAGKGIVSPDEIEFHKLCEPREAAVNAFLLAGNRIKAGQTFRDVAADYRDRVLKNPAGFIKVVEGGK